MNVGDTVRITSCEACPKAVGKQGTIVKIAEVAGRPGVKLRFGRGRPPKGRPDTFAQADVIPVAHLL